MRVVWLKGDYIGRRKERQKQAQKEGCELVVDFHFNSASSPKAGGAEVYYNFNQSFARKMLEVISDTLGVRKRGAKHAAGTRAAFILYYPCLAVLLEPCFVSNHSEVVLLHDEEVVSELGAKIASVIAWGSFKVVGLSIGHKFTTSNPDDRGARCVEGDWEADHAEELAKVVAWYLQEGIEALKLKSAGDSRWSKSCRLKFLTNSPKSSSPLLWVKPKKRGCPKKS